MKQLDEICVYYPERPTFTYWDVYKLIKAHSTIWQRLDPRKMLFMSVYAWDIFAGLEEVPKEKNWNFIERFWRNMS